MTRRLFALLGAAFAPPASPQTISNSYQGNGWPTSVVQVLKPTQTSAYCREFESLSFGVPNGQQVLFKLTYTPIANAKAEIFVNGALQREGGRFDYLLAGRSLYFNRAPQTGDFITVQYFFQ